MYSCGVGGCRYKDRPDLSADKQKVTGASDMTTIARAATDEFLLLCCDGIWDVMTNEQCVHFVLEHLKVISRSTCLCCCLVVMRFDLYGQSTPEYVHPRMCT
jgi:serine/threonine protein phosphatase PrpC